MTTPSHTPESPTRSPTVLVPLLVIAAAQLMVVLDDSIVNIALPSIQSEFHVAPTLLPWVVNAYILAFGALLLLGGRIGDLWGRKRTLQSGIAVFAVASLVGGLALNVEMLIAARAVQGLGAAMAAPNALALIATTFSERKMRDQALSLYGAMSGVDTRSRASARTASPTRSAAPWSLRRSRSWSYSFSPSAAAATP